MTRWGVYYGKIYAEWIKEADALIKTAKHTLTGPLEVTTGFRPKKPKTTKRLFPRGDLDNYEKALWDAITRKKFWEDDDLIVDSHSSKRFSDGEGFVFMHVKEAVL